MSGSTSNETILAGLNQVIQAINDLVAAGSGDTALTDAVTSLTEAVQGINLRPIIKITNLIPGGTCGDNCIGGGGPLADPDAAEGQGEGGEAPSTWEGSQVEFNAYKCKAATLLATSYKNYVLKFTSISGILSTISPAAFFSPLIPDAWMALISPALAFALFAYLVTTFVGFVGLTAILAEYAGNLEEDLDQFICDLYDAQDVAAARAVIASHIADTLPVGLPSSWVDYHITNLFPNSVINILFEEYTPALDVASGDCQCHDDDCFIFFVDEEGWTTAESLNGFGYEDATATWQDPGVLHCASGTGSGPAIGSYGIFIISPEFSRVVEAGDVLRRLLSDHPAGSFNNYAWIKVDGEWERPQAVTSGIGDCNSISLSPYEGQEATQIAYEWNWGTSPFTIDVDYVGYNCPECE